MIASKPDLRQHAYYEGLRLFRAVFSNLAIRSRPSAVLMRSLASDSHVAAMFRSICRCSGDLDWFAKPRHSLACCRYSETLRIPPPASKAGETHQWWGTFRVGGHSTSALFTEHTTAAVGGQARAVESAAVTERGKRKRRSPHLSRHLPELEDLRIIEVEWQGTRKHHSLNSAPLARPLDGRQSRFIQPCPDRVLCHEHRQSKRLCATVREMEEDPSRSAIRC